MGIGWTWPWKPRSWFWTLSWGQWRPLMLCEWRVRIKAVLQQDEFFPEMCFCRMRGRRQGGSWGCGLCVQVAWFPVLASAADWQHDVAQFSHLQKGTFFKIVCMYYFWLCWDFGLRVECWRIDAFELWCGEDSWESLGLQGDPTSPP